MSATAGQVIFDKQEQVQKVEAILLEGEALIAVYDCIGAGTGFVGVTDKRIILQDNSFVGKKVALTSLPYSKVTSVSFVSDKSMFGKFASSSSVAITVGSHSHEADFRGEEKAKHVHDLVLWRLLNA
jgi:hypothetical protein